MPLFLRKDCFSVDFQEVKRPLGKISEKRPIKVGKRPIKEGKRPMKAMVLVGISVGCLMGCFRAPQPSRKTAPVKRPIKSSMILTQFSKFNSRKLSFCMLTLFFHTPASATKLTFETTWKMSGHPVLHLNSLVFFALWSFLGFSRVFPLFSRVFRRQEQKSLGSFGVFLGSRQKTKERQGSDFNRRFKSQPFSRAGMNGNAFSIKAPKECSKKLAATLSGKFLPKEMILEYSFCS